MKKRKNISQKFGVLLSMIIGLAVVMSYTEVLASELSARPTTQTILLNGELIEVGGYNIHGTNFFSLRDMAYLLQDTYAAFDIQVVSSGGIDLYPGRVYTPVGTELSFFPDQDAVATPLSRVLRVDGHQIFATPHFITVGTEAIQIPEIVEINGSVFFALRQLALFTGLEVGFNSDTQTILLGTHLHRNDTTQGNVPQRFLHELLNYGLARQYSLALDTQGNLWAWFDDVLYEGSLLRQNISERIILPRSDAEIVKTNVVDFASSHAGHSFAVTADGKLWGWGFNESGNLGDGTRQNHFEPVVIMENIRSIHTNSPDGSQLSGVSHSPNSILISERTYAIDHDNQLWVWEGNFHRESVPGQLGELGEFTLRLDATPARPVQIMENIRYLATRGIFGTSAITVDDRLYSWGSNTFGQLGTGTTDYVEKPTFVMDNVRSVVKSRFIGTSRTYAVTNNNRLYGWGGLPLPNAMPAGMTRQDWQFVYREPSTRPNHILNNVSHVASDFVWQPNIIRTNGDLYRPHVETDHDRRVVIHSTIERLYSGVNFATVFNTSQIRPLVIRSNGKLWLYDSQLNSSGRTIEPVSLILRDIDRVVSRNMGVMLHRMPN